MNAHLIRLNGHTYAAQAGVYRLRDDRHNPRFGYAARQHATIPGPPMVYPMFAATSEVSGTQRTRMDHYRWYEYIEKLNPGRFEAATSRALAMFNEAGWPNMESLMFGCNLVQAVESGKPAWARIITPRWEDGPPEGMPTYQENPIAAQAFTCVFRDGTITGREPMLYYPVVSRYPVYLPWSWLEPLRPGMVTPAPPRD